MTISEQAKQVYELELKARLEAEHRDKYLAIEPQSKAYFLGDTFLAAALAAKNALSNHDAARLASLQSVKGPEHREKIAIPLAAIESALRAKSDPLQSLKALGVTDPNLVSVFLKDPELVNQAVTILGMWREEFALSDSTLQELLLVKDREDVEYDFRKWAYILYLNNSDAKQREREFQSRLAGASLVELESFLGYLASNFSAESPESKDWHSRTLVEFEKSLEADPHAGRMLGFVLHSEYAHDQKYADQVARCVFLVLDRAHDSQRCPDGFGWLVQFLLKKSKADPAAIRSRLTTYLHSCNQIMFQATLTACLTMPELKNSSEAAEFMKHLEQHDPRQRSGFHKSDEHYQIED